MAGNYFVYIVTNAKKKTLYTGVTNNLEQRLIEHYLNRGKQKTFTGRYYCYHLIFFERFPKASMAIDREKEIKGWTRAKKETLINVTNPDWRFLNGDIMDWPPDPRITSR